VLKLKEWVGSIGWGQGGGGAPDGAGPLRSTARATPGQQANDAKPPPPDRAASVTLDDRLAVLTALWGEGFVGPGGEEEALRLVKPLGLSGSHSLLHLGAGLGGGTRAIAKSSGAYVTGYELDATLAGVAAAAATKAGLAKRAGVQPLDPRLPAFRAGYFHHALAQEALWPLADKQPVLGSMVQAIKVGGQLMVADLVRADGDQDDAAWTAWSVLERSPPHLGTEKAIGKAMLSMGLDIRIVEDVSQRHINHALSAWMNRVTVLRRTRPTPRQAALLVREAELWLRRCRLMQDGRIRMLRWHSIRVK
jgi:cyclopropane fatty-acyl-phospholipid synthase-like methyltransferase